MQRHEFVTFVSFVAEYWLLDYYAVALVLELSAAVTVLMLLHCGCGHAYMLSHLIRRANMCHRNVYRCCIFLWICIYFSFACEDIAYFLHFVCYTDFGSDVDDW